MDKILLGVILIVLCVTLFIGNRYIKGWIVLENYKNNQILVNRIVDKDAFKYMMPGFTELPEDYLGKESIRLYYRDIYGYFAVLYVLKKQGMLLWGEWESVEGCFRGFIFQNDPTTEYAQMIVDGKRVWPEDFRLWVKKMLDKHKEK